MLYNPIDCYWFVGGDTSQVWSSARMEYVPVGDDAYRTWIAQPEAITSTNPSRADLADVMREHALPLYFASGITITSASNPAINGTYALDQKALDQVGAVARDSAVGFGLPNSAESFQYSDLTGAVKHLSEANVQDLYKAMRNYIAQTTLAVQKRVMGDASMALPSNQARLP